MSKPISRREFLTLSGAALLASALPRPAGSAAARQWTVSGHDVPGLTGFDETLRAFMTARSVPGGALAVTRQGRLVLARGYTYSDDKEDLAVQPTSLFRIASITKPFTATTVLRLVQDGRLALTTRLTEALKLAPPKGKTQDARLANVTVAHLLQHLGGWDRDRAFDPMFDDMRISQALGAPLPISKKHIATFMAGQSLQHDPGTTYVYSNFGYSLLGQIIEAVTGQPYEKFVAQTVMAPLGLTRPRLGRTLPVHRLRDEVKYHSACTDLSVFDKARPIVACPYGAFNLENMDAHGGWLMSAVDLVRFATAFDHPAASPLLDANSIATMFGLPQNMTPAAYKPGDAYYGCGWQVRDWGNGQRNTWHNGSLDGTYTLLVRRRDGLNWCVLFDQRDDPSKQSYDAIDDALHAAADAVSAWPDHDLFGEYLGKKP